jgi:hypothetical protein
LLSFPTSADASREEQPKFSGPVRASDEIIDDGIDVEAEVSQNLREEKTDPKTVELMSITY